MEEEAESKSSGQGRVTMGQLGETPSIEEDHVHVPAASMSNGSTNPGILEVCLFTQHTVIKDTARDLLHRWLFFMFSKLV